MVDARLVGAPDFYGKKEKARSLIEVLISITQATIHVNLPA